MKIPKCRHCGIPGVLTDVFFGTDHQKMYVFKTHKKDCFVIRASKNAMKKLNKTK